MRDLNYQLKTLCRNNRDGSYATQAQRQSMLELMANQLHDLGFRQMSAQSLKPKHVEALIKQWQDAHLAVATIKNRMTALRWWAAKVNRQNVIARANEHYGIPDRQFVTNISKALSVSAEVLAGIKDVHVRMSLELQQAFGLRREEAIKFIPAYADKGDHLTLKASWTKGGKARDIPIRTEAQREVLNRAHQLAGLFRQQAAGEGQAAVPQGDFPEALPQNSRVLLHLPQGGHPLRSEPLQGVPARPEPLRFVPALGRIGRECAVVLLSRQGQGQLRRMPHAAPGLCGFRGQEIRHQ
jgi:site-specific recombinase XerC